MVFLCTPPAHLSIIQAYWKSAQAAEEKERQKKQERVIKHWSSLVQGLRVRKRLDEQYLQKGPESGEVSENDVSPPVDPSLSVLLIALFRNEIEEWRSCRRRC